MRYTTTTMKPKMQLSELISNFGGTVGLYIGFSILTLAEVIEKLFNVSFILITYLVNKRKKLKTVASQSNGLPGSQGNNTHRISRSNILLGKKPQQRNYKLFA